MENENNTEAAGIINNERVDPEAAAREVLIDKRNALQLEQDGLQGKEELNVNDVKRLFGIQKELREISDSIEASMQVSLHRSTTMASFGKRSSSTPAARREVMFNDESAIQQAIENSSLSKNMLHIEPCKPAEGSSTISAATYRRWRKMFVKATESLTEEEKESVFLRSAGTDLMDVFEMLTDQDQTLDDSSTPFSDTLMSLDSHFESDGVKNEACAEFEAMKRNAAKGETNVAYLDRLARAAKNCGFAQHEFDKRLMTVLARNIDDDKVRKAAIEVDFNGKYRSYLQFRNHLRHMDLVQNIGLAPKKEHSSKREIAVHAIEDERSRSMTRSSYQPHGGRSFNFRDPSRARSSSFGQRDEEYRGKKCHRCGGGHDPSVCPYRLNTCFNCGKIGHMKSMCGKYRPDNRPTGSDKRNAPRDTGKKPKKQKIEAVEIKPEVNQVRSQDNIDSDSSDD